MECLRDFNASGDSIYAQDGSEELYTLIALCRQGMTGPSSTNLWLADTQKRARYLLTLRRAHKYVFAWSICSAKKMTIVLNILFLSIGFLGCSSGHFRIKAVIRGYVREMTWSHICPVQ
eukprot:4022761-Pleurochrysis_carterae.AAC.1